ncbi:MAG: ectonucleotide pyrophosphatase/phosphodiesterase [Bdellovibrionota bacterium]
MFKRLQIKRIQIKRIQIKAIFLSFICTFLLNASTKPLLLISIDGLRPADLSAKTAPNMWQFAKEGTRAKSMKPIFPSLTFPNHYTLVTGLYSEKHGITGNEIRDPNIPERFSLGAPREVTNDPRWWIGEPIWVTAQKQGLRSGILFWPGSEAPIQNILPTHYLPYDYNMSTQERIEKLLSWVDLPIDERPEFFTLYIDTVDSAGHRYGPGSTEVLAELKEVDNQLGTLFQALQERNLFNEMNIIIVSDHGMTALDSDKEINVTDVLADFPGIEKVGSTGVVGFFSKSTQQITQLEKALKEKSKLYKVYQKKNIPARFHYKNSDRIPDLLLVGSEGTAITARVPFFKTRGSTKGAHGYDNNLASMQAVFMTRGPSIEEGKVIENFDNIHVYSFMCKLLGIKAAPNNGRSSKLAAAIKKSKD